HRVAVHFQIDGDGRAAELGMGGGAGVGVVEPPDPRDRPGELDDAAIIDLVEHCRTADLPGRALVYCLHPPIDYIGAGAVEWKCGPGASAPLCRAIGETVIGETMDAAIKQRSA